jgi:glycosyltransferase involved in cell wall biosynthesis
MRILSFKHGEITSTGGIYTNIMKINTELVKKGHTCTIITTNPAHLPERDVINGVNIIRVNTRGDWLFGLNLKVYHIIKKNMAALNPDIIHLHGIHGFFCPEVFFILKGLLKVKQPIVYTVHTMLDNHATAAGRIFGTLYNYLVTIRVLGSVDRIMAVSNYEAKNLKGKIPGPTISIVPHGVDEISILHREPSTNSIKLLYAGHLIESKGVQYIIEALHTLVNSKKCSNISLQIIGEGPYLHTLQALSKSLRLEEYICWKPFLPHSAVLKEIADSDVFLLLSQSEVYGIVVAEALSLGVPAIVTNGTALEEFTSEPGCFGVDWPPDRNTVADLILRIIQSNPKVGPFSRKIRTWDIIADDYVSVYREEIAWKNNHSQW